MLVVENTLTSYCNYAKVKRLEIMKLRTKFKDENSDEAVLDVNGEEEGN
jgi:hypothetical protein